MTATPTALPAGVLDPCDVLVEPDQISSIVSVDTETSGLYIDDGARVCAVSVAYRTLDGELHDYAFPFDQGRATEKGFEVVRLKNGLPKADVDLAEWELDVNLPRSSWEWLVAWLLRVGRARGLVTQNGKFDYHMILTGTRDRGDGGWPGVELSDFQAWDTQLTNRVLWPTELTALKPTAARLWGEHEVEEAAEVKKALADAKKLYGLRAEHGPRYDLIPWSINGPYAAKDSNQTLRLCEYQVAALEEGHGRWDTTQREKDLGRVLYRIEKRRFGPYDVRTSKAIADRITERIAELEPVFPFQPPTAAQATAYYYDELGLAPWKPGETPRGYEVKKPRVKAKVVRAKKEERAQITARFPGYTVTWKQGSLTGDIAERMGDAGAPFAHEYAEYLRLKIANQMFYQNYVDLAGPDDRLMTNFKQAEVKSGRMSVERFQAQALPKKLELHLARELLPEPRSLFGVEPGKRRWNLDLSQAELRIASELAECHQMATPLREGQDLHGQTCTRIFHKTSDSPDWKRFRDVAKRLNFGGIFMIGAATFQENLWLQGGIEWPLAECKVATDGFKRTYPEIVDAYEGWQSFAASKGYVTLANGERSWLRAGDYPNTAWNRVVQGSLAAWVAEWLILIEQETQQYEALTLTVHDSAVLELPEGEDEAIVARIKELSEELWYDRFGFVGRVDTEVWS